MEFRKITSDHIKKYRSEVLKSSSASTFDRKMFSLKKFFEWALKEGYMDENPIESFLKSEAQVVETKLGKIEKERKANSPSYNSTQARIIARLAGIPKLQKLAYHAFYTRPKWYNSYHNLPIAGYFNYAILILLMSSLGFGVYNQFFKTTSGSLAYPTTLTTAGRFLSFQGRLTNNLGNPITTSTNLVFKLYNIDTGGTALWNSNSCSISPDTDGIFSTLLGSSCGTEIPASVFSENSAVWLGVTVGGDTEATPRVQIATVAYALNSETLQGYPASATATINTVPVMNNSGQIVLASNSPKIQSTSGNFAIEGQALTITTPNTSNGSITINPDGTGTLNLTFEGAAPGGTAGGFVNATNANLTSGSLYYGEVASDATGYNLLELASGATARTKFAIDSAGNATLSGTINGLAISGGTISTGTWNGSLISTQYGGTGANNSGAAQYAVPYYSSTGVLGGVLAPNTAGYVLSTNSTGGAPTWIPMSNAGTNHWQLANNILAPINVSNDLTIGGNATGSAFQVFGAPTSAGNVEKITSSVITTGNILSVTGTGLTTGSALYLANNTTNNANLIVAQAGASLTNRLTLDSNGLLRIYDSTGADYLTLDHNGTNAQITTNTGNIEIGSGSGDMWLGDASSAVDLHFGYTTAPVNIEGEAGAVINFTQAGNITSATNNTYDLGAVGNVWNDVYATVLHQGSYLVCDSSGANCPAGAQYWRLNGLVLSPVQASYDLTVGANATGAAFQVFAATGNITTAGNLDVNGTTNDIAGTLNLSGNTLTSTGDLTINPGGGDVLLGASDNLVLTSAGNLFLDADTALSDTALNDAGSYGVGTYDDFTYSASANVQGVLKDFDTKLGTLTSNDLWRLNGLVLSPIQASYDLTVGANATGAAFQVFAATGNVTLADLVITGGNINPSAALTIGDNGDTLTLDSSDWDIGLTGDMAGIGSITADGTISFTGTTIGLGTSNSVTTFNVGTGTAGNTFNIATDNTTKDTVNIGSALDDVIINGAGTGSIINFANFDVDATGNIDVNGTTNDIAGTLNLSGNTLTSTGDLTINPTGGDVLLGASDNLVLTSAANLYLDSDTSLFDTNVNDAGAYLVGTYDDFTYSASANVQGVLKDFDTKLGTLTTNDFWQLTTNSLSPSNSTYALNVGNTASTSAFFHVPGTNNQDAWFNLGTGKVGIGTTTPQTALSLGSTVTSTGISLFNTADETTNYERLRVFWNNNDAVIKTEKANTGLARNLYLESGRDLIIKSASGQNTYLDSGGAYVFRDVDNADATVAQITSTNGYARFGDSTAPGSYSIEAANGLWVDSGNAIFDGNVNIAGYATASGSLALGNTTAAIGPGHLNMSGNLTTLGTINGLTVSSGTISSGTWNGTAIGTQWGGTGQNWASVAQGSIPYFNGTGTMTTLAPTTSGYVLTTQGAGANPAWTQLPAAGTNYWQLNNHVLSPANYADYDLAIGGTSTASAKFQVLAANGNLTTSGTASVSGNLTIGYGSALQSAYGPLTLNYKSGADTWSAGLTVDDMTGYVGIGATNPIAPFQIVATAPDVAGGRVMDIDGTLTSSTNDQIGLKVSPTIDPVGTTSRVYSGMQLSLSGNNNTRLTNATFRGIEGYVSFSGATGILGTGVGGRFRVNNTSTGTITNAYANYLAGPTNAGTITNTYGLYVESQSVGTQTNAPFAIYQAGASDLNYFAGNVGIGIAGPTAKLDVNGNVNIAGYATMSASLAVGNTTALAGVGNINASGRITGTTIYQGANQVCDSSGNCPTGTNYWQLNGLVLSPANAAAYDLTVGGNATGSAFQVFAGTGNITTAGNLDVNGSSSDIAGTLNLSGNTLTSTGDLTINPTGGDVFMGSGDNFVLTSAADLFLDSDTALSDTALNDAGAYLVGTYDDFNYSNSSNVQAVLKDLDTAIAGAGGVNHWQLASNVLAPINVSNDLAIGGNATASAKFQVFGATGNATMSGSLTLGYGQSIKPAYGPLTLNYKSGADAWSAGLTLTNSGYVGIGTTSPTYKLDVVGDIGLDNILYHNDDADTYIEFNPDTIALRAGGYWFFNATENDTQDEFVINDAASDVDFRVESITNTASLFVQASDGNVGINSTSPLSRLSVVGTSTNAIGKATFLVDQYENQDILTASASGATKMTLTNTGNLTVTGTLNGLTVSGGTISGGTWNGTAIGTQWGGTGQNWASVAQGSVPYFNGTGTMTTLAPTTSGYVLTTQGTGANPAWTQLPAAGTNYWQLNGLVLSPANATAYDLTVGGNATGSAFQVFAATGNITTAGDLAVNGDNISADGALGILGATGLNLQATTGTVTIDSIAASQIINMGASNVARTINIGTGIGIDTIHIGDGATGADVITIGSANAGAVTVQSGAALTLHGETNSIIDFPNFDVATTGTITTAGNLDVNGTTNDIAGTLNLSGNTLTSTGDLTINPTGGDVLMGASDNLVLTSAGNLFLDSDTALSDSALNDAGAYLVGAYDDFTYSSSTNVQGVLKDLDTAIAGSGVNYWQLANNILAPVNVSNDLSIGGNATASSKFQIMGATGNIYTANNTIDWTLNNAVDALNIDSDTLSIDAQSNRVGIGKNAPNYMLDVAGSAGFGDTGYQVYINGQATGGQIYVPNTTLTIGNASGSNVLIGNGDGISILGSATGAQDIIIDPRAGGGNILLKTGNVGINTVSPLSKLSVVGTATSAIGKAAFLVDQYENQDILTASASGTTKMTLKNDGTLSLYNATSTISNTSGDITLNAASNLISFSGDNLGNIGKITAASVLNAGGLSGVNYNTFAGGGDAPTSTAITTSNDLFVGGDTELKGGLYLTGKNIFNVVGGVSTGTVTFANDPTLINSYNALSYGGWLVNNSTNNGIAALMVNQNKGGDIFSASSSGTTKFTISNAGNVQINSTDPLLTFNETDNVAWQWKVSGDQWIIQRALSDQVVVTPTSFIFKQAYLKNNDDALVRIGSAASGSELRLIAGAESDYLTIQSDGDVGIGTTTPTTKLTLYGTNADLLLQSAANDIGDIIFQESDGNQKGRIWTNTTAGASGEIMNFSSGDTTPDIIIDTNGYVGIGNVTPSGMSLEVLSTAGGVGIRALNSVALGTGSGGTLWAGTSLTPSAADQRIGGVFFAGSNSSSYAAGAAITGWAGSAWSTSNIESNLRFETTPNAGTSRSERMRITADGNVGIGTTTPGTYRLAVNGTTNLMSSVYYNGTAYVSMNNQINGRTRMVDTGCAGSWASSCDTGNNGYVDYADALVSDSRLKTVTAPLTDVMDKIVQLRSVYYNWNDSYKALGLPEHGQEIGFIAQEVQQLFPELVYNAGPDDPYLHLDYQKMTAILAQGIKEQQIQIDSLSSELSNLSLTTDGDLSIAQTVDGEYIVEKSNGEVLSQIGAFAKMIVANIEAGAIVTKDLATTSFTAFQGSVDNMLVKSGLVAGRIETKLISPIPGEDLAVELPEDSKFKVQDSNQNVVASIDSEGNATFSGTLYAEEIKSKSLDEIRDILTKVETDQALLTQAADWNINTATASSSLIAVANISDLYVTNQAAINSLSVTNSLAIGTDMVLQSTIGSDQLAMNSIDSLTAPLRIQSLAMAPIEMMAGLIKIDTLGNVIISGNLAVGGGIESGSLNLVSRNNTGLGTPNENATASALLTLQNSTGTNVASVDASGSAIFNSISTQGLTIAGAIDATNSAVVNGVITTNATAGSGVIPAETSEITIRNANVTDYTLVYVTPTSSTDNYVLYVKSKSPGEFVVGFTNPISIDVNFNWWIVKVTQ